MLKSLKMRCQVATACCGVGGVGPSVSKFFSKKNRVLDVIDFAVNEALPLT